MHKHPLGDVFGHRTASLAAPRTGVPKAAWALGVVVLGIVGLVWWSQTRGQSDPLPPPGAVVVCDCCGPISDWVLSLPDGESMFFEETQASLIAQADPRIQFHVFYGIDARRTGLEKALAKHDSRNEHRVKWHKSPTGVWPWTRDLFLAASTPAGDPITLLHHPQHYSRWDISWKATEMGTFAGGLGAEAVQTPMWIDGGGIVVDEDRVLVSKFFVDEAVRRGDGGTRKAVVDKMRALWGRPVEIVEAGLVSESHHCDLVMMPACANRMVLASPVLGAKLLAATDAQERARFTAACRKLAARAPVGHRLHGVEDLDIVAALLRRNNRPEIRKGYERLRRQVEKLGYTCIEVPLLTLSPAESGFGMTMSYANAVIDGHCGERVVYMPTYQLPTLDHAAADVWRKLGIRVAAVDALGGSLNAGGIHCLSQVFRPPHAASSHPGPQLQRRPPQR